MFVGKRMTKKVVTVMPKDTLKHANHLLKAHRIQHLPVVEGKDLVGIVSGTDIRNSTLEITEVDVRGEMTVKNRMVSEIMIEDVITVSPWDTVEDALLIFHRRRFGALPVVEGKKLVGIITKVDILSAFIDTLSIEEMGVRIEVFLEEARNEFPFLIQKINEMNLEIQSLILSSFGDGFVVFIRLSTIDVGRVKKELTESGFHVPELSDFLG